MFIKEIIKKNPTSAKTFTYYRLMEAVRTARGPRQRIILNLGKLDIPKEEWKTLANRIEEIITGQQVLIIPPPHIESLAHYYAGMLRRKEMQSVPAPNQLDWETVDLDSARSRSTEQRCWLSAGWFTRQVNGIPSTGEEQ